MLAGADGTWRPTASLELQVSHPCCIAPEEFVKCGGDDLLKKKEDLVSHLQNKSHVPHSRDNFPRLSLSFCV